MKRGDIFTVTGKGDFSSKPRPAVIIQADLFNDCHPSLTVCPISATLTEDHLFRIALFPAATNGLKLESEIEIDKIQAIWLARVGKHLGAVSEPDMYRVDEALRRWLDL